MLGKGAPSSDFLPPAEPAWWIYRGDGLRRPWHVPDAPPWRRFDGVRTPLGPGDKPPAIPPISRPALEGTYQAERHEIRLVNAAIRLRRPLLVTGRPGTGKSTLAYSIAHELNLGRVLHWSVSSRSTLADGLYAYDAIGRLQDRRSGDGRGIGEYIRLGPLGTALLPRERPRVLLIDELDKADLDLPNDLLSVFEEGEFTIPELQRHADDLVPVMTDDAGNRDVIREGRVRCAEFPIVVLTSNAERDFPPAFLRRCIRLDIEPPTAQKLDRIVRAHLGDSVLESDEAMRLVRGFLEDLRNGHTVATDQLLNALSFQAGVVHEDDGEWREVLAALLRPLDEST